MLILLVGQIYGDLRMLKCCSLHNTVRLSQGLKSEYFVLAKSGTYIDFTKPDLDKSKFIE